jgi:hypothetical protein
MLLLLTQMGFFGEIHVFLHLSRIGLFGTSRAYLHLETPKYQVALISKSNSILTGKHVQDVSASSTDGFLLRDTCVSLTHLSYSANHQPEKPKLQEIFLSKSNSVLTGKQCTRFSNY